MFKNYFKTAWRNLRKNKVFSFINILGLTIGITTCMMIFLFIMNEFSFDRFHKDGDRIYRVMRGFSKDGETKSVSYLSGLYAPALQNEYKGLIESVVRVSQNNNLFTNGDRSFNEKKVVNTDANFFTFFSFPLLKGDPKTALQEPHSVVMTETTAKKYFGNAETAMGKTVMLDKETPLTVTGIAKDVPSNSHLEFDIVVPLENYKNAGWMTVWINNGTYTYAKLAPNITEAQVEKQLPAFMEKYLGSEMRKYGFDFSLSLIPLKEAYFSDTTFDATKHGDKTVVYIFLSIAILILLIACINFINLSTIRSAERSKEVGLRKVLGALRNNIIWQFIGESVLLTAISCVLSLLLILLLMPWYNQLLGYSLTISWNSWPIYLFLAGVIVTAGLLAGSYPAFVLSAFSPVEALKGKLRLGKGGASFRQALVVIQFTISVFLIVGTFVINKQMNYVKNKQLGYNKEQTLLIRIDNEDIYRNTVTFKNALQGESKVQSVSLMSGEPGGFFDGHMFNVEGRDGKWNARTEFADFEFAKTLGVKVIAGRDFSAAFPTDSTEALLINKTAATKLGWTPEQAIGKWIENTLRDKSKRRVIGVVEDFNFQSLKNDIEPLVIAPNIDRRVAVVKLKPGNIEAGVAAVEKVYKSIASAYPFEYRFLDQQFDEMYRKDIRQQTVLSVFAVMAIFVACLGLFGLASFTAIKRFKEIGVRKVLGSSVQGIVVLLSKDLLKPVIIATCIALPVGYWAMNKWLQNFAYKTTLNWWVFAFAALLTFGIAFVTICAKAIKAALANPVKSLRSE
ncbi:ABC transporter permease [Sediminibacterium ginsengisoli]|uniref:Putative ABC transport system permease protein n=1 Tax=Sediminibacterium ginsengisoli TaxID=413434 RepID=A0A1T4RR04_9BACT|nr:ABC transporter permease [Sediminibacterium ginsengisoli]SKA18394.1 putative ABC transport system permease protein [Sediminibacterium ginsengisoli]